MTELKLALDAAELAERDLSYVSECGSEAARKLTGSYYTPKDVAAFFWREYFSLSGVFGLDDAKKVVLETRFIEPAAGAGALVFSLLVKLAETGLDRNTLSKIDITVVDINQQAIAFIEDRFHSLSDRLGVHFPNVRLVCADFRTLEVLRDNRPLLIFGNPPFVKNDKISSNWKNLYADFLEIALDHAGSTGGIHFIVPLSIAFSRDYRLLRKKLRKLNRKIALSNFDNIPDTLFKSGKPEHTNTNKANSQRCTIITSVCSDKSEIISTELLRWSKFDREKFLSSSPLYHNISEYYLDDQFPRPKNSEIIEYLDKSLGCEKLGDLINRLGSYELNLTSVARNFIGIREESGNSTTTIKFSTEDDFLKATMILSSDVFLDYWLSVGDGFHLTKSNIFDFPIHNYVNDIFYQNKKFIFETWNNRNLFKKKKMNSGRQTYSFDFSNVFPSLYDRSTKTLIKT